MRLARQQARIQQKPAPPMGGATASAIIAAVQRRQNHGRSSLATAMRATLKATRRARTPHVRRRRRSASSWLASRADENFARGLIVEHVEIDFSQHDARCGLSLEAIDRFEQDIAFAVFRVTAQIVRAGKCPQPMRPELLDRR